MSKSPPACALPDDDYNTVDEVGNKDYKNENIDTYDNDGEQ